MTFKAGILLARYRYSQNLIFINIDNSLHGPYGDITSTLKFNYILELLLMSFVGLYNLGHHQGASYILFSL